MVSTLYGTLPIVHATGGLRDTITPLDVEKERGNGFAFEVYDTQGFRWAIDQAMRFYRRDPKQREAQIARIMRDGEERFNHKTTAKAYFDIYKKLLRRPLTG